MLTSCRGAALLAGWSLVCLTGCHAPERKGGSSERTILAPGPGVILKRDATTYFGSPYNCSRPAVIDQAKVQSETPEWQTISSERVQRGSARYQLLQRQMHERILGTVRLTARARRLDLVVAIGDIEDNRGMKVTDITSDVVENLGSGEKTRTQSALLALPAGLSWAPQNEARTSTTARPQPLPATALQTSKRVP